MLVVSVVADDVSGCCGSGARLGGCCYGVIMCLVLGGIFLFVIVCYDSVNRGILTSEYVF